MVIPQLSPAPFSQQNNTCGVPHDNNMPRERVSYIGITSAFQADERSSTLLTRSRGRINGHSLHIVRDKLMPGVSGGAGSGFAMTIPLTRSN